MNCIVCGNESTSKLETFAWNINQVNYHLEECGSCHSSYTFPLPTDNILQNFYAESFDYNWYQAHNSNKLADAQERYNDYKPYLGEKIIDYGGGMGYFSKICRDQGYQAVTYDPYTTNERPDFKADTIVCNHMLEHSNHLDNTMKDFISLGEEGCHYIIAVPNASGYLYQKLGMASVWAQPPIIHLFHFTKKGLPKLLEKHGLKVIDIVEKDRWDASYYADYKFRKLTAKIDSKWNLFSSKFLQKLTCSLIGIYRRALLELSNKTNHANSELLIIAQKLK